METYQETGLAQYYGGSVDKKSKPKSNVSKPKKKKKRKNKC